MKSGGPISPSPRDVAAPTPISSLPSPVRPPASPLRRQGRFLAFIVLLGGLAVLLVAALGGHYFVLTKGLALPLLALVAVLSGHARAYVRDWLLFLVLLLLFDGLRGAIFVAIFTWELPWYMGYAIDLERLLFGVGSLPHWLHERWPAVVALAPLRSLMVLTHASHFIFFFGFGCVVYHLRREAFGRFQAAMLFSMFGGLLGYLAVPTVPPWMAANFFAVLPPIERLLDQVYNTYIPSLFAGFQTNAIAAMPSLHAAFPTVCCAIGWRLFGWRALPLAAYTALAYVSPIYLGEHYAVDILAGALLGLVAYALAFRQRRFDADRAVRDPAAEFAAAPGDGRLKTLIAHIGPRRCLAALAIFYLAMALGYSNKGSRFPELLPDHAFIDRELAGNSDLLPFFAGLRALEEGRHAEARRLLADGLAVPAASRGAFTGHLMLLTVATEVGALPLLVELLDAVPAERTTDLSRYVHEEARRRVE